ncbi:MAG: asparagine synthase (glutamine-hydrolyzing) [Phycisphaerales bacterium]|nr:asparagine synthase (glutamine-hydrolyzing) [Phycisphaerales bacterium]
MCGILGVIATRGRTPSIDEATFVRLRDRMTQRGPDDAGLWRDGQAWIGHRRLSVLDPARGHQPMVFEGGRPEDTIVLTYNGELYNHPDLRRELESRGHRFRTTCDAETVLHAIAEWGPDAYRRFRGMFALAAYEPGRQRITLARDPLGIKPLHYAMIGIGGAHELAFASEVLPLVDHPHLAVQPDWMTVSAYLTTIRTTLGSRSLFQGVSVLQPGEVLVYALDTDMPTVVDSRELTIEPSDDGAGTFEASVDRARTVVEDSVRAHLLSDVPVCALLSGGLDSSIIASIACEARGDLLTFCAGAESDATDDDLSIAPQVAAALGTEHHNVRLDADAFHQMWPAMIRQLGVPLSTPNEVAIYAVSAVLSTLAKVVLSGEGADELFAGYGTAMDAAAAYVRHPFDAQGGPIAPGLFHLASISWIPLHRKAEILTPAVLGASGHDLALVDSMSETFEAEGGREAGVRAFLGMHRHHNLAGLLGRLDTATMLTSVEGRTPFADIEVARCAAAMPLDHLFRSEPGTDGGGTTTATATETKRVLRAAFESRLPAVAVQRPKASFPLPFRDWLDPHREVLDRSGSVRSVFSASVIDELKRDGANANWATAWPLLNIAQWMAMIWD